MDETDEIKDDLILQTDEWFDGLIDSDEISTMECDDKKYDVKHDVLKLEEEIEKANKSVPSTMWWN